MKKRPRSAFSPSTSKNDPVTNVPTRRCGSSTPVRFTLCGNHSATASNVSACLRISSYSPYDSSASRKRRRLAVDRHQPIGVRIRQRPQQHGVDDAEHGGVGADAERQRQDGDEGESRPAPPEAEARSERPAAACPSWFVPAIGSPVKSSSRLQRAVDGRRRPSSRRPDLANLINPFGAGALRSVSAIAAPRRRRWMPRRRGGRACDRRARRPGPEADVAAEARRVGPDEPPRDAARQVPASRGQARDSNLWVRARLTRRHRRSASAVAIRLPSAVSR